MTDKSIAENKSHLEDPRTAEEALSGSQDQKSLRSKPVVALIIFSIFALAFLEFCFIYTVFSYLIIGESGPAFLGGLLTLLDLWLMKTLVTARRKKTQPWKIIHLPTQNPQPRRSLQPFGWTAIAFGAAAIALTGCAIHTAATYHKHPWSAYILVPACIALATTAIYGGRKHALANGPHPGGPIWWLNDNYHSRLDNTDPTIGGAIIAGSGLIAPFMAITGQVTDAPYYVWTEQVLTFLLGAGIITMGRIQKRWERKHPHQEG